MIQLSQFIYYGRNGSARVCVIWEISLGRMKTAVRVGSEVASQPEKMVSKQTKREMNVNFWLSNKMDWIMCCDQFLCEKYKKRCF